MAEFDRHCQDCEKLLADRHEDVNRWMDGLFWRFGPRHRRFRHCTNGIRKAGEIFGPEGAKAAIVHVVRDIGAVPKERDYDVVPEGIEIMPAFVAPSCGFEQHFDLFKAQVEEEIRGLLG